MDFQKYILDQLLDKYEKSKHYQGEAKINRPVSMSFSPKAFPPYWEADKPFIKEAIHQVVAALAGQGIVSIRWLPFEKGNIIKSLLLNLDFIEPAYQLARRVPKENKVLALERQLVAIAGKLSTGWLKKFITDCIDELRHTKDIPGILARDPEERDLVLKAVLGLEDLNGSEILERVFSLKYLGDSKVFQKKVRRKLAAVARRYYFSGLDLSDDDVMSELGINKTSEEVLIYGPVVFSYQGREIDYSPFPFGGILDSQLIKEITLKSLSAGRVVTVENKANFHYLVRSGLPPAAVLIYLGGFPGPYKRMLLEKIFSYQKDNNIGIVFQHWGDIDAGGFKIFHTLERVVPTLTPVLMDKSTLLKYRPYCEEIEKGYLKQIEGLLLNKDYRQFEDTLSFMLKEKIKLEQEAVLVDDEFIKMTFR